MRLFEVHRSHTCLSDSCNLTAGGKEKEVLLVFPGKFKAPDPQVPLATPLHRRIVCKKKASLCRVLDMRLEDYRQFKIGDPFFVGISCMSGLQIKYALEFARFMRTQNPSCPLVWGGVHPTLLPEQTAINDYVDIVVRGEGELIIKDLANALASGQPLDNVAGITYQVNGEIKSNPDGK